MNYTSKIAILSSVVAASFGLGGCGSSSSSSDGSNDLPLSYAEGLKLTVVSAMDGAFYSYDTCTGELVDLNDDPDTNLINITGAPVPGHFLVAPVSHEDHEGEEKAEDEHDEEELAFKFLLMNNDDYQSGSEVTANDFSVLFQYHEEHHDEEGEAGHDEHEHEAELEAYPASEYSGDSVDPERVEELEDLNEFVTEQAELSEEVEEALTVLGKNLCRAYIDPYMAHEHEHEEDEAAKAEDEHDHEEVLVHYALSTDGNMYFFEENEETEELTSMQEIPVKLTGTTTIADCNTTSIGRINEEGVMVFVEDTQMLYLVDSHDGADFHLHSSVAVSDVLPAGVHANLIAITGEGGEHDHDHE